MRRSSTFKRRYGTNRPRIGNLFANASVVSASPSDSDGGAIAALGGTNNYYGNAGIEKVAEKTEHPTERPHHYLTPTSPKFQNIITKVVPLVIDEKTGKPSTQTVFRRAPLESRAEVEKALATARQRAPRLPLVDEPKA